MMMIKSLLKFMENLNLFRTEISRVLLFFTFSLYYFLWLPCLQCFLFFECTCVNLLCSPLMYFNFNILYITMIIIQKCSLGNLFPYQIHFVHLQVYHAESKLCPPKFCPKIRVASTIHLELRSPNLELEMWDNSTNIEPS